jgi:hypothetical protein
MDLCLCRQPTRQAVQFGVCPIFHVFRHDVQDVWNLKTVKSRWNRPFDSVNSIKKRASLRGSTVENRIFGLARGESLVIFRGTSWIPLILSFAIM